MTDKAPPATVPYGSWPSPITAASTAESAVRLGGAMIDGDDVYWLELRPTEGGRLVLVRAAGAASGDPASAPTDVTPAPFNVRTLVHEYGGGACTIADGVAYASNFADQRLYAIDLAASPGDDGAAPRPLTPDIPDRLVRYAAGAIDRRCGLWIGVREDHRPVGGGGAVTNEIACVPIGAGEPTEGVVLASGHDFYGAPAISPDGARIAYVRWNFPNMPWDDTELVVADVVSPPSDGPPTLANERVIAGGPGESVVAPAWSPDGALYFASDRTDAWNLYRVEPSAPAGAEVRAVCPHPAEFAGPMWTLGGRYFDFAGPDRIVALYNDRGVWRMGVIDAAVGRLSPVRLPYMSMGAVHAVAGGVIVTAGAPDRPTAIVRLDLGDLRRLGDEVEVAAEQVLRRASAPESAPDPAYVSIPEIVSFPSEGGRTAHAIYYPPKNSDVRAPDGDAPPLIVKSHGGPTSAAGLAMNLEIQFWTSRGFAVIDVNYGGSTGYGRAYRDLLRGAWGVVDVEDCAAAARYLADQKLADRDRLAIRGGSAGGFTTLAVLTFRDEFGAGASYYGVSDLSALAEETHKFESRYLDQLIGPYPERRDLYEARSPIHHVDRLARPVIFLQGLEDKVVPPNQSERMADALRAKGIPVAYVPFEGEQHGFRQAANIVRALEAELYFYGAVFGFAPADDIEPVAIDNL